VQIPFNVKVSEALGGKQLRMATLMDRLRPEFDGVVLWALAGLKRVLASGKIRAAAFTQSAQATAQVAEHKVGSNSFLGWLDECAELSEMAIAPKPDVYDSYKRWCADSGVQHPLGKHSFGKELRRVGVVVRRAHRPPDWYVGLKLRGYENSEEAIA
jgi:phage/plasmid-associated DNA primase